MVQTLEILFWVLLGLIFYSYLGYGIVLYILVKLKRVFSGNKRKYEVDYQPRVTLMIAAYNEKDYAVDKAKNSLELDYPKDKLDIVFVTDGSDDGTPDILNEVEGITVYHKPERAGKIAAMNRGMKLIDTPIVVFTDANTMLNKEALREIINHYQDPKVGCVAGEKRIQSKEKDSASGAGEGIYWKYESTLKRWDFELYSAVGAAGELFSVRTELHREMERDTLLDDFVMSLRIAEEGYKIAYEPNAYATESASASVSEEMKRKIRICAGGIQSIVRLKSLLNPFKHGILSFQYVSHRVLRWTITPLALLLIIPLNIILMMNIGGLYTLILYAQALFYAMALIGWYLENRQIKVKILFIPFYFFIMNLSVYLGFARYLKGQQSVLWERAKRA